MSKQLYLRFKICRWLDKDEFKDLVRLASYIGRRDGCSWFEISFSNSHVDKLLDLLDSLKTFGAEFDQRSKQIVDKLLAEANTVEIDASTSGFLVRSRRLLLDYLSTFRAKGLVRYSRNYRGFIVKPYAIVDVIDRLQREGFKVKDNTGLLYSKKTLNIVFNGKLRSYQEEAINAWRENRYRGVIALPTGSGKTIVALAAMVTLSVPTLIVVYTREQLNEWAEKIVKFTNLDKNNIGLFYSEQKSIKLITIATYQSAFRNIDILFDKFSLLIVDEAHHLPAEKFRAIAESILAPYRLGLSATPYREDGRHEELFRLVGGVVYERSLSELLEEGFIASFEIVPVLVQLERKEFEEYKKLKKKFIVMARGRKVDELVKAASAGDDSAKQALQLLSRIRRVLALSKSKVEEARRIVENELAKGSKIIIFTQYVDQAETIGKELGIPVVTGKTEKHKRRIIFELYKRGRFRAIVLTTVGDEGIDIPDANVGIVLSGTSSRRQFIQRLGRLLRPQPGKVAKLYYIAVKGTQEETALKKLLNSI
ncbi:DNA repair helicase RAD25 [Pyrodictium delaneyi]|uniref:DNA 3'-5' helicase n=1 Tax=Pyrodictium delaneyi TaxID=1273541 RepID=A0A0P0N2F2_9CREN|nr:DEAD/DEAH box helicase [Pyrodictium delaneyi]ALL01094.1 DNA repair helicase RAD25 [Pyrodictium delaneyi]